MGLTVSDVVLELGDGGQKITALDHVTFGVADGELLAVLGPSGAGKSSLLAVCGGLRHPTSGAVSIGGKELTAMQDRELTRLRLQSIGFVFQQSNLISSLSAVDQLLLMVHLAGPPAKRIGNVHWLCSARWVWRIVQTGDRISYRVANASGSVSRARS
jgi:putative ABC transport system ATP-binding protein